MQHGNFQKNFSMHFAKIHSFSMQHAKRLQVFAIAFNRQIFLKVQKAFWFVLACVLAYEFCIHEHVECSAGIPQKKWRKKYLP